MKRFISPNLSYAQAAELIGHLQTALENVPEGSVNQPCCRLVVTEYSLQTKFDVVDAEKRP